MDHAALAPLALPPGLRTRSVENVNGLRMHMLEAGFEQPGRPLVLLLHGFPDLAYSWRKTMLPLAQAGYHVIAPDQRGYGRTTGWDGAFDGDVAAFRTHNFALDALALVAALGYRAVDAVVGHDFGSMIAAYCALVRPDMVRSVVLMSLPFDTIPPFPLDVANRPAPPNLADQLAALPRPRKDSMAYFASRDANADMLDPPQGLHDFLRAYFHVKSADWAPNAPHPLPSAAAADLAELPTYYIMDQAETMPQTVAPAMPSPAEIAAQAWLSDAELQVYTAEYRRTGFQGGLNWFRCHGGSIGRTELGLVRRADHRRARQLHLRPRRLGRLPQARRRRADAHPGLHPVRVRPSDRGRGPLGPAGAGGAIQRPAGRGARPPSPGCRPALSGTGPHPPAAHPSTHGAPTQSPAPGLNPSVPISVRIDTPTDRCQQFRITK